MQSVPLPRPIELNEDEQDILKRITFDHNIGSTHDEIRASCAAAAELACLLLDRGAIPEIRRRFFTDPDLNIGGHGKSHYEVFESNGTRGEKILKHGNFLKYLKYFIYGPDLPESTIQRFRQIIIDDQGTSGMVLDQMCRFVRSEVRRLRSGLSTNLHEEFYKLALECELDEGTARTLRDAARQTK